MALKTELLITLQQIKGLGNKTILNLANSVDFNTIEDLCSYIGTIKSGRLANITADDLHKAYRMAQRIIEVSKDEGIGIISYFQTSFPQILRECKDENGKLDPPIVLYYRGNLKALDKPGIAIIGTREPTANGTKAGLFFSKEFAKCGFNIISGLAIGCDTAGHRGALDVDGTTTAFLATGLNWNAIYPKENLELAKEIVENGGLLLSEYHIEQKCGRFAFVARDRLQAGLSYATVAIQTGINGGTMHAVNATLKSDKLLFVVKYNKLEDIESIKTQGNKRLIEEGKAICLSTKTLNDAIKKIHQFHEKENDSNQSYSLFDFSEIEIKNREDMRSIIFDLDLTLVDTTCLEEARHNRNWREAYSLIPHTTLYNGIKNVLDIIRQKGTKVAIVSTAPRPYIERIVSYHKIPAKYIVGYHDAKPIKPHPASMLKALDLMGEKPSNVISFGDRAIDIQASNAAGIESVACLWGSKEREKLLHSEYKHIISIPQEMLALIGF